MLVKQTAITHISKFVNGPVYTCKTWFSIEHQDCGQVIWIMHPKLFDLTFWCTAYPRHITDYRFVYYTTVGMHNRHHIKH